MKIESEDIDVENLLEGKFFKIPRFQRPYSWDDENIQDLWDDVVTAGGEDYFIGSMVVYQESKQELSVVDGQQRLTTITLFLCAIRDAFKSVGELDLAEGLHQLIERKNRVNKYEYVLRTETSFPFLQEKILKFDEAEISDIPEKLEEQALRSANALLVDKVSQMLIAVENDSSIPEAEKMETKVERLVGLRDAVLNLKIILVKLENEDDAYLIFETLNTRGKDLAVTDLLKNHFAKLLKAKSAVDAVKLKWNSVLERIHESSADLSADAFLYHFWASRHEAVPLKKLYSVMKRKVHTKNARSYLDALVEDANLYRSIYEPSFLWEKHEVEVARSLDAIQLFRVAQPAPALLSLVRAYRAGKIRYRRLADSVAAIEKFHFAFTAVTSSRSSGGISGMYSAFARKLFESEDSNQAANEIDVLVQKLRDRRPNFAEFELGFAEIGFTNSSTKQKNLVRYILRKFAVHSEFKFAVDWDELTIEHVQPQSKIDKDVWPEEVVGQLGNLFLLDGKNNQELAAKSFPEKKAFLIAKGCSVPDILLSSSSWDSSIVEEHTAEMAKVAYADIWKI